jgi:hypothetical protein
MEQRRMMTIAQLRRPLGRPKGDLIHGGSLYRVMNDTCSGVSIVFEWVSSHAHLQSATAAQEVVKNLIKTKPAEIKVITSDDRRRSDPLTYRGAVSSPALYPSTA